MKASEIKVGGVYLAKVNGRVVPCKVDLIEIDSRESLYYTVTNTITGRKTTFRSPQKFRSEVKPPNKEQLCRSVSQTPSQPLAPVDAAKNKVTAIKPTATAATVDGEQTHTPPANSLSAALNTQQRSNDKAPHLIVEARAGTGKTTTLVEGLKYVLGGCSTMTPSPQQKAVWDSMALSAGHTRTVCFCAFNKSIASELQTRVPKGCDAMTMHSMGFKSVMKTFGRVNVNSHRVQDIIARITGKDIWDLRKKEPTLLGATEELVGLCKMKLVGLQEQQHVSKLEAADGSIIPYWNTVLSELASRYDVDLDRSSIYGYSSRRQIFELVPRVLEACKDVAKDNTIDYDDMVWLPVALNLPVFRYDLLLIDECQDLNRCQQALAKKAGKRLILCGDPKQAIYGFAGADSESMSRMQRELGTQELTNPSDKILPGLPGEPNLILKAGSSVKWQSEQLGVVSPGTNLAGRGCVTLPLTVTRRCGRAIVAEAQKIVPDFEAHETCPAGLVDYALYTHYKDADGTLRKRDPGETYFVKPGVNDGDMILCRVNAPLVSQCFQLLKMGRKANIQGRDIGQGLISTIRKQKVETIPELLTNLFTWLQAETAKEQANRHPDEAKLIALTDRVECISCFTEGCEVVDQVVQRIEQVFTDDKTKPGVRLSSIHKAKGLEANRVFFLMPPGGGCPHPMAKGQWQQEQEMHLKYVAQTRAIHELWYVS